MSTLHYLSAVLYLAAVIGSVTLASVRVRRSYLPELRGAAALLAEVILAIAAVVVVGEVLGSVGAFRRVPLLITVALLAVVLTKACPATRPSRDTMDEECPHRRPDRRQCAVAMAAVAAVVAVWGARTVDALRHGIVEFDSLNYHLPMAARFVQDSATHALNVTSPSAHTSFHPANSEIVHAVAMIAFGRDVLSPVLNLGWLFGFLFACWCIGRQRGVQPITMTAGALIAGLPVMSATDAGSAGNDIVALFFVVSTVAILASGSRRPAVIGLAGLAAGLGMGTKLSVLVTVVAITAGVVVTCPAKSRVRSSAAWLGGLAVGGSYWFLRNLVATGNPVPSVHLRLGAFGLPSPKLPLVDEFGFSVAHYLGDSHVVRGTLLPGLGDAMGPLWALELGLGAGAVAYALLRGRRELRVLAVTVVVAAVGYLVTPTTAIGPQGAPVRLFFAFNVRYLAPALLLALICLVFVANADRDRVSWIVLGLLAAGTVSGTLVSPLGTIAGRDRIAGGLLTVLVAVGTGAWVAARERRRVVHTVVAVVSGVGLVLGLPLSRLYLDGRYRSGITPADDVYRWAQDVHDARIAVVGQSALYPVYGSDLSNEVRYVAHPLPHGGVQRIDNAAEFIADVHNGRFQFVVTQPYSVEDPFRGAEFRSQETDWLLADPRAHLILGRDGANVFAIDN